MNSTDIELESIFAISMKNCRQIFTLSFLFSAFILMNGCKKDPDQTPQSITCKINGVPFTSNICVGTQYTFRSMGIIGGQDSVGKPEITFSLYVMGGGITTPGTFSVYPYQTVFEIDSGDGKLHRSVYGIVHIEQLNPLKGTFEFTCQDSLKITDGVFTGRYVDATH